MLADFDEGVKFVLDAEGGYSDDPDDPGGATNLGIEQTEYDAWRRGLRLPVRTVRLITNAEASALYKARYWDAVHGDYVLRPAALVLFDTAVNTGCGTAISQMQAELNVPVTACFDRLTSEAYQRTSASETAVLNLALAILDRRTAYYRRIVSERPKLGKFLDGWLSRVRKLQVDITAQ